MSTAAVAPAAAVPAKKGGAIKLIIAVLVAAGAAGGGAWFVMGKKAASAPAGESVEGGEQAADEHGSSGGDEHGGGKGAAASDFFPLNPQFVINLNDEEAMRFLQAEVQVIASKARAMDAVKLNDPIIRNRLMLLFSSQKYHELLTREGKEKLQGEALAEINKVLDEQKKPHIDGVVFTNFVMQ